MTDFRGGDVIKDGDGTTWVIYENTWLVISEDAANMIGGRFTLLRRTAEVPSPGMRAFFDAFRAPTREQIAETCQEWLDSPMGEPTDLADAMLALFRAPSERL
jgi:hypothetical protein